MQTAALCQAAACKGEVHKKQSGQPQPVGGSKIEYHTTEERQSYSVQGEDRELLTRVVLDLEAASDALHQAAD